MEIVLDGNVIENKELLFETLKKQINSDEFYGNNLDSLWDVLSNYTDDLTITVMHSAELVENLGNYAHMLMGLFDELNQIYTEVVLNIT